MYAGSERWYDALYSFKDYAKESEAIVSLLEREHPSAETVLDVACGTGEHDRHISRSYRVDGLDVSKELLRIAAAKNPGCGYFPGDMASFDLGRRYDAVLCMFSSIGYARTYDRLVGALRCFERHLNPGGLVLVEPWFTPDAWRTDGRVYMLTAETSEGKVCRMNVSKTEGGISVLVFHYLAGTASGVEHLTERHELGLFTLGQMTEAFRSAGLSPEYDGTGPTGRGLYLARRAGQPAAGARQDCRPDDARRE